MPTLSGAVLSQYRALTLYNSPYAAHDRGCAVDLYPGGDRAPSPVSGEVVETRRVRAPPQPYAERDDHLVVIDDGDHLVRVLHAEPSVAPGDSVRVGDDLGRLVRAGFFAPWVDNHLHVGFRRRDADPLRASGSLPLALDPALDPVGLDWDGTGHVAAVGETFVVLDEPTNPSPGDRWVGVAADTGGVLDGGLVHYDGGGLHGGSAGPVELLGQRVGTAAERSVGVETASDRSVGVETASDRSVGVETASGRSVGDGTTHDCQWEPVAVYANGERVTGLSLYLSRERFGVKVICPNHAFAVGDHVEVTLEATDEPIVLG